VVRLLLALALAAMPGDGISAFAGGQVKSPDGTWRVWAAATDPESEETQAIVRLNGPGVNDRGLMRFERSVDVIWPADPSRVVLVERSTHFAAVHVFTLGPEEGVADRVQANITTWMSLRGPEIGRVENRLVAFGEESGSLCLLVEESGLPPGRDEGSFVARRGAFVLDVARKRAVPVRSCAGAVIPG
jgi:hypothetical protein